MGDLQRDGFWFVEKPTDGHPWALREESDQLRPRRTPFARSDRQRTVPYDPEHFRSRRTRDRAERLDVRPRRRGGPLEAAARRDRRRRVARGDGRREETQAGG